MRKDYLPVRVERGMRVLLSEEARTQEISTSRWVRHAILLYIGIKRRLVPLPKRISDESLKAWEIEILKEAAKIAAAAAAEDYAKEIYDET